MRKLWSDEAWDDYLYWQANDKKLTKKVNELLKSIERDGVMRGKGKPEPLRYRKGYSRRIDDEHRLIYEVEDGILYIYACKGHYDD